MAPRLHELIVERDRFQGVVAWVAQELHVVLGREVATLESDSAQLGFEIFPAGFAQLAALLRQLFPQVAPAIERSFSVVALEATDALMTPVASKSVWGFWDYLGSSKSRVNSHATFET